MFMPGHVRRVRVTVDVDLERRVDRDDAEPPNHAGVVAQLLRAQDHARSEEIEIVVYALDEGIGECQRRCACTEQSSAFHQRDQRVLEHLREHHEVRDVRVPAELRHDRVRHVAHARLQRQELRRDASHAQLLEKEPDDLVGDPLAGRVGERKRVHAVGRGVFDDADDSGRVDLHDTARRSSQADRGSESAAGAAAAAAARCPSSRAGAASADDSPR